MNLKTIVVIFAVVFIAALGYLLTTGFVANLTGNVVGEGSLEKNYYEEFQGDVSDSKTFDLGKIVTIDEIEVSWTDNLDKCWAQVKISEDGTNWFTKQSWKDIASPSVLMLEGLGDARYIMFEESSCASYSISSMKVTGTYIEE
jgi:hypothetical protein